MSIPNVSGALRGWTKKREVKIVTKTVENFLMKQSASVITVDMMNQPLRPEVVNRKPEEQRAWKWQELVIKSREPVFKIDDYIVIDGIGYRVSSIQDWNLAGYRRYEVYEDYSDDAPTEY